MKGTTDWQFSQEFADATPAERELLLYLSDILYRVQYTPMGKKPGARRAAALTILKKFKRLAKEQSP
jgi:hypothetical protein